MKPCNALVLLGYSNTGKDTIASLLSSRFTGVTNAKFSALTKQMLADVCAVPVDMMENREWRENTRLFVNGTQTCLTPFDLLTALYAGAPGTQLASANVEWTLKHVGDSFPVFTDIRRCYEFNAVADHYHPLVILLNREGNEPGVNDGEILTVFNQAVQTNQATVIVNIERDEQPTQTFERVVKELHAHNAGIDTKHTLHIIVAERFNAAVNHIHRGRLPAYEPLAEFAIDLANLTLKYNLSRYAFNRIFEFAVHELNWAEVEIARVNHESAMAWNDAHTNILEQLRSMANLKVTVLDDSKLSYAYETFARQEIEL